MSQCSAKANSTRLQCRRRAITGANVCQVHGGAAPQVKRKAAQNVAMARAEGLLARYGYEPVTDPFGKLLEVAGRFDRLSQALEAKVDELKDVRYGSRAGEQLRAEVSAYTVVLDRLRATLNDIGRLDIDARLVKIKAAELAGYVDATFLVLGWVFEVLTDNRGLPDEMLAWFLKEVDLDAAIARGGRTATIDVPPIGGPLQRKVETFRRRWEDAGRVDALEGEIERLEAEVARLRANRRAPLAIAPAPSTVTVEDVVDDSEPDDDEVVEAEIVDEPEPRRVLYRDAGRSVYAH